jgi:hypothetical protein
MALQSARPRPYRDDTQMRRRALAELIARLSERICHVPIALARAGPHLRSERELCALTKPTRLPQARVNRLACPLNP